MSDMSSEINAFIFKYSEDMKAYVIIKPVTFENNDKFEGAKAILKVLNLPYKLTIFESLPEASANELIIKHMLKDADKFQKYEKQALEYALNLVEKKRIEECRRIEK